jgi:D-sedoheptulose 7-phosphate isomerase
MGMDVSMIRAQMKAAAQLIQQMEKTSPESILRAAELILHALQNGKKILLCGNGGSAADCQHIAAEFVGRYRKNRRGLPAIALTTDTSILTAVGNDFGFHQIFRRQVEALGECGDVLIAMSTSGTSPNVLQAIEEAKLKKMKTVAIIGGTSGHLTSIADAVISVPSSDTPRIQEAHCIIGHILCDIIERAYYRSDDPVPDPVNDLEIPE